MTFSIPKKPLSGLAIAAVLTGGSAYAEGNAKLRTDKNLSVVSEHAIAIVAANNRETNLRKTTATIIVMGAQAGKKRSQPSVD